MQFPARADGRPFAQKILASCPNFYETTEAVLAYEGGSIHFLRVNIPPKFELKLRRHKQTFRKIATTVALDKDENLP